MPHSKERYSRLPDDFSLASVYDGEERRSVTLQEQHIFWMLEEAGKHGAEQALHEALSKEYQMEIAKAGALEAIKQVQTDAFAELGRKGFVFGAITFGGMLVALYFWLKEKLLI